MSLRLSPHEPSFFDTEVFGLLPIGDRFPRAPVSHLKIENFQGSAAGIHLVVMGEIGEAFEDAEQFHAPGPAQDLHIARPARRAEWPQPRKVVATLRGWRNGEAADARTR